VNQHPSSSRLLQAKKKTTAAQQAHDHKEHSGSVKVEGALTQYKEIE
jgi:hypothetical protein